jgi:hypothetical protein
MKKIAILMLLLALRLLAQPMPLTITVPDTLPIGMQGKTYTLPLTAQGGTAPYSWTVTPALPDGLQMDGPFIEGTPTGKSTTQLTVTLKDSDPSSPATVQKTVTLTIQGPYGPYADPIAIRVCQMDDEQNPPIPATDDATGLQRCFLVPEPVSDAMTKFLVSQTNGLDANGNVAYKYASWWDYVVKFFIDGLVFPVIDQFPSPDLAAAKAQAAAAAAAVNAAKAAMVAQQHQE